MEGSSSPPRESRDRAMRGIEQSFQKRKEKGGSLEAFYLTTERCSHFSDLPEDITHKAYLFSHIFIHLNFPTD
jgi:hypothetical protein